MIRIAQYVIRLAAPMLTNLPTYTSEQLIAFEADIAAEFLAGHIRAPIHLSGGNEQQLIDMFRHIAPTDYVLSTWRSHYHALLKGVDPAWLRSEIGAGRSMYIHSREHRFLTSSIAGGILPIGLGIAKAIQLTGGPERVWCFVGDMTARMGIFHECLEYATGHDLPYRAVVEDNGLSTNTPTVETWGRSLGTVEVDDPNVFYYHYQRTMPHVGAGRWVEFEPRVLI